MTAVVEQWTCTDCDTHGTGSGRAADKHTRTTGHSTRAWAVPQEDNA